MVEEKVKNESPETTTKAMYPARYDLKDETKLITPERPIEPYIVKILTHAVMNHPGSYLDGLTEEEKQAYMNQEYSFEGKINKKIG